METKKVRGEFCGYRRGWRREGIRDNAAAGAGGGKGEETKGLHEIKPAVYKLVQVLVVGCSISARDASTLSM
jgi:hypothetical protein